MVYLLADWGMGDSEICNRNYADKSSHDLLRIERDQLDYDDEVDLHPLSNQVSEARGLWFSVVQRDPSHLTYFAAPKHQLKLLNIKYRNFSAGKKMTGKKNYFSRLEFGPYYFLVPFSFHDVRLGCVNCGT